MYLSPRAVVRIKQHKTCSVFNTVHGTWCVLSIRYHHILHYNSKCGLKALDVERAGSQDDDTPRPSPTSYSLPVRVGSDNLPLNASEKRLPSVFFSWRFKRALWENGLPWPTRP